MKKFNKIVTVIVAFAMIVSSLTMLAIHDEHVHVHAAETVPTGKVWALHDKNANDEYIAFSANNTSPFSFYDVHQYYTNDTSKTNVTGNNEQYDGRTFGRVNLSMLEGEKVQIGGSGYYANKAAVYQKDGGALIAAMIEPFDTNKDLAAGEIWGTCSGVNTVAVVFTAPETGNYTLSETARRWWPNNATYGGNEFQQPCKIVIEHANGKETKILQTGAQTGTASVTLNLVKGETVKFFMDSMGNGSGDNFEIEALTATYNGPANLTVGETFTFSNYMVLPGSANNGKFTMKGVIRTNPTYGVEAEGIADAWAAYDTRQPVEYSEIKNMNDYDANQYVMNGAPNNSNEIHKMILNGLGAFYGTITCEAVKILSFTAPVDGNYTLSFNAATYWGAAVFSSIGENDLRYRGMIHSLTDNLYTETVYLKAGETYNVGITRATGNYNADTGLTPFTDGVGCTITNYKVTYNGAIKTYNFLDSHFGGDSYVTGNGVFTVGVRGIAEDKTDAVGAPLHLLSKLIDENSTYEDQRYYEGSNEKPARVSYITGEYSRDGLGRMITGGIFTSTAQDNTGPAMVNWTPSGGNETAIRFTAPTCGTYSFDFIIHELWGDAKWPSRYYVEANGQVLDGCNFETPGNKDYMNMTGTVTLKGGESIYFVFNPGSDKNGNGNSTVIDKLVVTVDEEKHTGTIDWAKTNATHSKAYTCCGKVVEAVEAHSWGTDAVCDECGFVICNTTFDFVPNFADLSDEFFTFGVYHTVHNFLMGTTTVWYNGNNESVTHPGSGKPLHGYRYQNSDGYGTSIGYIGSDLVWATGNQMRNLIIFTAPADGTYTYDFEGCNYWGTANTSALYFVEVNGQVHNNNSASFELGLSKAETAYDFEGTVELKAGETIYFCYDPEDNSAGDNGLITKLQVTLNHEGGEANCKNGAICDNCGAEYTAVNPENHTSSEYAYADLGNGNHKVTNKCCGATVTASEAHVYGDDSVCDKCSNACTHSGGTATCKTQATCTVCGQKYGELDPTNHEDRNGAWTSDKTGHSFNRTCCDATDVAKTAHNFANGACTVCGYSCTTNTIIHGNVFGSSTTDGYLTYGYVPGDNGGGSIHNRFVAEIAPNGTTLFRQVNGVNCMSIVPGGVGTGYTSVILFTAPVAGTYKLHANFHKWGSGSTVEVGFACPPQNFYKGPGVFSENDVRKEINETITLAAGEKVGFYVRGWAAGNISINSFSITRDAHEGGTATCTDKAVCTVCGLAYGNVNASNHTNTTEFNYESIDANNHKVTYKCCGATKTASEAHNNGNDNVCDNCGAGCNHTGGTATCKTQATCDTCGQKYGNLNANNHEDANGTWTKTQDGHSFNRTCCDATDVATADHTYVDGVCTECEYACVHNGGTATCKTQAVCDDCGESYGNLNANNHEDANGTWTKDQNGHSFNRTCCDATDVATEDHDYEDGVCTECEYTCVHNGGEATCKTQAVCDDCGESYGNLDATNHEDANGTWTKDQDGHAFNRTCCDATDSAKADHTYVDGVCSTCQYACVHNGGNATCTDKAVCDDCGKEYGDTIDHNYVNGTCTECGDEDPDYVAPSPDTGDNTLAYALLIAGLGLLTFALIPSKKRR